MNQMKSGCEANDNSKGELWESRCALSGPIDRVTDDGVGWRNYIKRVCEEKGFGIRFFDPCDKPKNFGSEIGVEKYKVKKMISEGRWEEAQKFVKNFRHYDLRAIDWCDFVIAKVDVNVHMCGSYDEMFLAEREHKLILVIMGEGQTKKDIPLWLVSFINEQEIFNNEDECIDFLSKMDKKEIKIGDRWLKFY